MKSSEWGEGPAEVPHSLPSPLPPSFSQGLSHPGSRTSGTPLRADITPKDGRTPTQQGPRHPSWVNELRWLGKESGEHQTWGREEWGGQLETGGDVGGSLRLSLAKVSGKNYLPKTTETCDVTELLPLLFLLWAAFILGGINVRKQHCLSSLSIPTPVGLLRLCCAVIRIVWVSGPGGLCSSVKLYSSSQQCLLPALRRGAGRALVKHFGMEITIYNCNTSAFLNTENKKRKAKREIFSSSWEELLSDSWRLF